MKTLTEIRTEIDALDAELAPLLVRRLEIADEVVAAKRAEGRPIDDPAREQAILDALAARAPADSADALRAVYRTIFAESKARQQRA